MAHFGAYREERNRMKSLSGVFRGFQNSREIYRRSTFSLLFSLVFSQRQKKNLWFVIKKAPINDSTQFQPLAANGSAHKSGRDGKCCCCVFISRWWKTFSHFMWWSLSLSSFLSVTFLWRKVILCLFGGGLGREGIYGSWWKPVGRLSVRDRRFGIERVNKLFLILSSWVFLEI